MSPCRFLQHNRVLWGTPNGSEFPDEALNFSSDVSAGHGKRKSRIGFSPRVDRWSCGFWRRIQGSNHCSDSNWASLTVPKLLPTATVRLQLKPLPERNDMTRMLDTIEAQVGNTPLVRLQRLPGDTSNLVLAKLEGNNPAGSVKDRPAMSMIRHAEFRGELRSGDTLIEATSGNTGIALAMAAAIKGYRMVLIMPSHMSQERQAVMRSFGAEIVLVSQEEGMEGARDLATQMELEGKGRVLDQFANPDNPLAHYEGTGPEIWSATGGRVTHFVSSMGTTGTIMGVSRYLKERNPEVQIVGVQPGEGAQIPGIRRWPDEYLPKIFDPTRVDRIIDVTQKEAEDTTRQLSAQEGIFAGISSGGAVAAALRLSGELEHAVIAVIICDRGDRYLSTGVFPA